MMNDNPHMNNPELQALGAEIDRLAFLDRGDAGLEARIFAATLPALQSAAQARTTPPLRLVSTGTARVTVVTRETRVGMRIAAGFAIAATAALAWMGTHRPSTHVTQGTQMAARIPAPVTEASVDEWAIASAVLDDGVNDEIDDLARATSTLRSTLDTIGTGESYEEAM
jgi:hypothetical protein